MYPVRKRKTETDTASKRDIVLTDEQLAAVDHLLSFPKDVQTLGGYAGTGKTTVIKSLKARLPHFAVCAYTGKAANVLRTKGVPASTIHSLIYTPVEREYRDKKGNKRIEVVFILKSADDLPCQGFVVDEASMVGRPIYDDLLSFDLPIIFVGDHGQLEPVEGRDFNLMANPDVTLQQIHRNAGEIAHFAEFIRKGNTPVNWVRHRLCSGQRVHFLTLEEVDDFMDTVPNLIQYQIICAYNRTRVLVNKSVRESLGYPADQPLVGDRVICLQNDHDLGIFNGMTGEIAALVADEMVFRSNGNDYRVRFVPEQFNEPKRLEADDCKGRIPFDYSYCITCHKAQGDEWDKVLVFEQRCKAWDQARWCYTAASRARRELIWVVM
jgi:exodeoxyribonuclease-5